MYNVYKNIAKAAKRLGLKHLVRLCVKGMIHEIDKEARK